MIFGVTQSHQIIATPKYRLLVAIIDAISVIHEEIAATVNVTIIKPKIQWFTQLTSAVNANLNAAEKTAVESIENAAIS